MQKKFNKFLNQFSKKYTDQNLELNSIQKHIIKVLKSNVLCFQFSHQTRYIDENLNIPNRWSKSLFRNSFAMYKAKKVELPLIKSKETYFADVKDFVLCLSDASRVSVELTYGKINFSKIKTLNFQNKINDSIVLLNLASYNPWHYFTEILSLANDLIDKNIFPEKKIYIPYNPLFIELIKIIDKNDRIRTYKNNKIHFAKNCFFLEGLVGEMLLSSSINRLIRKLYRKLEIKDNAYNYKHIYIGRNDKNKFRNRRSIVNEKKGLEFIKKKYPKIKIIRPGYISIVESIKFMYNCEEVISPLGTQLVLNSLFSKNLKKMAEMVPELYQGFTTGELVANYKNSKYKKLKTQNTKIGWPLYINQKIDLDNLKRNL